MRIEQTDWSVALVSGSTSGIGEAVARKLAADGMRVVVHSRRSAEADEALASELGGGHDDLAAATPADWRQLLEVNLIAPWVLCTAALPALRKSPAGGSIVNITSHAGVRPKGSSVPYAASKAALNHVTRLLATAHGPEVRVNAAAPGLMDTPMTKDWAQAHELWRERAPMRRPAQPGDVADLVATLRRPCVAAFRARVRGVQRAVSGVRLSRAQVRQRSGRVRPRELASL